MELLLSVHPEELHPDSRDMPEHAANITIALYFNKHPILLPDQKALRFFIGNEAVGSG